MKCDELEFFFGGAASLAEVYKKSDVDAAIDELKAIIHELESTTRTDNSAVIGLLSDELEKLRPMEAALEIAEADNKKYIERIKELEAENEKLKEYVSEQTDKLNVEKENVIQLERCWKETERALWIARAKRAIEKIAWFKLWNASISTMNPEDGARQEYDKWKKALGKFLAKAEEYNL